MRHALLGVALTLAGCGGSTPSDTTSGAGVVSTLSNDGFVAGAGVGFQGGFVSGEEAAVTLGPVGRSFKVKKVRLLFGGAMGSQTVTLRILSESGAATPGTERYSGDFMLTASDTAMQELDLTAANVTMAAGSMRVSIGFQASGLPSVARDGDGSITANRNWIYSPTVMPPWLEASTLGVTGDWIIRAEVETL